MTLIQPAAAPSGGVGGAERLDQHALVAPLDRVGEESGGPLGARGDDPRHPQPLGDGPGQRRVPFGAGRVEQVGAVEVQDVEQEHRQRHRPRAPGAARRAPLARRALFGARAGAGRGAGRGHLERLRAAVRTERDQLAVEDRVADRQPAQHLDHLGQPAGDVVERAGEDLDRALTGTALTPPDMDLRADAVELPFDRDLAPVSVAELGERLADRWRGGGEHRLDRAAHLEGERVEGRGAAGERGGGDRAEGAAQHRRTAHPRGGNRGGRRDRLGHHAVERALAQLAGEQPDQEPLLGGGRPAEQGGHQLAPPRDRALAGDGADCGERGVDLRYRQGRLGSGRWCVAQRRVPDADLALRQLAGQVGDHDGGLRGIGGAQARGQRLHLGLAAGGAGRGL